MIDQIINIEGKLLKLLNTLKGSFVPIVFVWTSPTEYTSHTALGLSDGKLSKPKDLMNLCLKLCEKKFSVNNKSKMVIVYKSTVSSSSHKGKIPAIVMKVYGNNVTYYRKIKDEKGIYKYIGNLERVEL